MPCSRLIAKPGTPGGPDGWRQVLVGNDTTGAQRLIELGTAAHHRREGIAKRHRPPRAGEITEIRRVAKVVLARRVRQELLDLDWPLIDAVENALGLLERGPCIGHPLRGRLHGPRSLRSGAYRIIYQLAGDDQTVRVATIDIARSRTGPIRADVGSDRAHRHGQ
jgi:mRNA-degrading endonuclease RelE of RelBE toxin-antitoxin system